MDGAGLWELFFVTGLPEVYLAIRTAEEEPVPTDRIPEKTADWEVEHFLYQI